LNRALVLVPPVFRDKARRAEGSGSTRKRRNAGSGNRGHQPRRGSAAFARARRCGSLVQNDCTAVTAPCAHAKATRARARDSISVSLSDEHALEFFQFIICGDRLELSGEGWGLNEFNGMAHLRHILMPVLASVQGTRGPTSSAIRSWISCRSCGMC